MPLPPGQPGDPRPRREILQARRNGERLSVERPIANEIRLELVVNERRLVAFNCSELLLSELVLGFLWLEQLISGPQDVDLLRLCREDRLAEVRLAHSVDFEAYERRRTLTSGCGGGVTFQDLMQARSIEPVTTALSLHPRRLFDLLSQLYLDASWYRASGGLHAAALSDGQRLLASVEDLGRHNCVDKLAGVCLLQQLESAGRLLLSTGRASSEMVIKAARMRVPLVVSRTSATDLAVELAESFGITLVGYARGDRLSVYTHPWRLLFGVEHDPGPLELLRPRAETLLAEG